MTDAEYCKLKGKIEKYIAKWRPMMGLGWWTVGIIYEREHSTHLVNCDTVNSEEAATTAVQYPYRTAQITFFLPSIQSLSNREIEDIVIHECCHILVNEMRDFDKGVEHEERVVTDIKNALVWTYQHRRDKDVEVYKGALKAELDK